jgi:hypothetical protein
MKSAFLIVTLALIVSAKKEDDKSDEKTSFQGQKLSWTEEDGLEIKIVRPISEDKCKIKSQKHDILEQ